MDNIWKCRSKDFRVHNAEVVMPPWHRSQFIGKALRGFFLLGFIVVLASCPMPTPQLEPNTSVLTANAGTEQVVVARTSVTLDGSGSTAATRGTITSYGWELVKSIPAGLMADIVNDASTPDAAFMAPNVTTDTTLEFRLTVTGSNGETASDTVNIAVSSFTPLMAKAGDDQLLVKKVDVTLDGSDSTAATGGTITRYEWELAESIPAGTMVEIVNDVSTPDAMFTAPDTSTDVTLVLRLTVTGSDDATSTDTVNITVSPSIPIMSEAGDDQSLVEGTSVTLDGSDSTATTGGTITRYEWELVESIPAGTMVVLSNDFTTPDAMFTAPDVTTDTTLEFRLTVTGSDNVTSSDTVTITVFHFVPLMSEAGNDQSIVEGTSVTLDGSGSTAATRGTITRYEWELMESIPAGLMVEIVNDTTTPDATFTAPNVTTDTTLSFRLTITGSDNTTSSDTVTITVSPSSVTDPLLSAQAGSDQDDAIEGSDITLDGSGSIPESASFLWEQINIGEGKRVHIRDADGISPTFKAPFVAAGESIDLEFRLTATSEGESSQDSVIITVSPSPNADADEDGLIEIDSLLMLHNMRYDLAGRGYKTSAAGMGDSTGCPTTGCIGYELTQNLNFDTNGNGAWTSTRTGYILDINDDNNTYFDVAADGTGGWVPIGTSDNPFTATFDGNGNTISNLAMKRDLQYLGFFGFVGTGAVIRNIGLVDNLTDYSGNSNSFVYTGGLVAWQDAGSIIASYTTGPVDGGDGGLDTIGALVAWQQAGNIIASYARGSASGGGGGFDRVGGLVGQQGGSIIASYATGNVDGGAGNTDNVGGLVGYQFATITASYATGNVDGGAGYTDYVGALVGYHDGGYSGTSYGFGTTSNGERPNTLGALRGRTASTLTRIDVSSYWNSVGRKTRGAWNLGTTSQSPVLNYADYDGPDRNEYSCAMFPESLCNTIIPGQR